jgi:hypothetical protein
MEPLIVSFHTTSSHTLSGYCFCCCCCCCCCLTRILFVFQFLSIYFTFYTSNKRVKDSTGPLFSFESSYQQQDVVDWKAIYKKNGHCLIITIIILIIMKISINQLTARSSGFRSTIRPGSQQLDSGSGNWSKNLSWLRNLTRVRCQTRSHQRCGLHPPPWRHDTKYYAAGLQF